MTRFGGSQTLQIMYEAQAQLTEKTSIAERIHIKNLQKKETLIPSNHAELIVPLSDDLEIKMVGTFRGLKLKKQEAYFLKPRGRGMLVFGSSSFLLIKIHPGYSKNIAKWLDELSNGIYTANLSESSFEHLMDISKRNEVYELNDFLEEIFQLEHYDPNQKLKDAIELMSGSCGSTTIKDVYTFLDVSKSTLEQRFNKDIGLTPKEFCKVEKLNCFIKTYRESGGASLTELTYQCGYYDQSHLIKDFRYFLDMSPREYFQSICKELV